MNRLLLFHVLWWATFLSSHSLSEITSLNTNGENILPVKAWIVYTESAEGSVTRQSIISDETNKIMDNDKIFVRIEEIRNPLNVFNQTELYIVFPVESIDGLSGYYIIVFTPKPHLKGEISYFELDYVQILKEEQIKLVLGARTNTLLNPWLYFSEDPKIEEFWGISEVNKNKLQKTKLINAIRFSNKFIDDIPKEYIDNEWHEDITLSIDSLFSKQGKTLELAWNLLQSLDSTFSTKEKFLTWDKNILSQEKVEEVLARFSDKQKNFSAEYYIKIEFNDQLITVGKTMVASIEKEVAFEKDHCDYVPGHVLIGVHF